jgi:ABC-type Fe3+ transport system permease subunit
MATVHLLLTPPLLLLLCGCFRRWPADAAAVLDGWHAHHFGPRSDLTEATLTGAWISIAAAVVMTLLLVLVSRQQRRLSWNWLSSVCSSRAWGVGCRPCA